MKKVSVEKIKVTGDIPAPRFGHTFTMVSNTKAVLFGGAVSIAGTFLLIKANLLSRTKHIYTTSKHLDGQNSISN